MKGNGTSLGGHDAQADGPPFWSLLERKYPRRSRCPRRATIGDDKNQRAAHYEPVKSGHGLFVVRSFPHRSLNVGS